MRRYWNPLSYWVSRRPQLVCFTAESSFIDFPEGTIVKDRAFGFSGASITGGYLRNYQVRLPLILRIEKQTI